MAMASALRRLSSSSAKTQPFLRSSLYYMVPSPANPSKIRKKVKMLPPLVLFGAEGRSHLFDPLSDVYSGTAVAEAARAPFEVVDPEIADIVELEKARQWKYEVPSDENHPSCLAAGISTWQNHCV
ncbi:hypothetical protein BHE74_00042916 [Ensete ventricosum]|nr:hypothetical protein BHE74_00042916 [Ensete ventricosum]